MKNIIIAILIIVIGLLAFYLIDPGGIASKFVDKYFPYQPPETEKVHSDSILIARTDIILIKRREAELIAQHKADSIKMADQKKIFHRTVAGYEKKLAAVNFVNIKTSDELDSIRNMVYPPGDSAFIVAGPDPLYTMPFSQARDAMEAKAREPFYDSINGLQAARIDTLEAQAIEQATKCDERIGEAEKKYLDEQIVTRNQAAIMEQREKKEKKRKVGRVLKDVAIAVVAFFAGKA
jgi:hypothetical protein